MMTTKPALKAAPARPLALDASNKVDDHAVSARSGEAAQGGPACAPGAKSAVSASATLVPGLVMGVLHGFDSDSEALVRFEGSAEPVPVLARTLVQLTQDDIGKMLALQFERGDISRPVILGLLAHSARPAMDAANTTNPANAANMTMMLASGTALQVSAHGEEVVLSASRKLTLRCGRASLTLDVDGNIEVRGQDVLSRAGGQNRIKGSSISLN